MYEEILSQAPASIRASKSLSCDEMLRAKVDAINSVDGHMDDGVSCAVCRNRGYLAVVDGDAVRTVECRCMTQRRARRRLAKSGLADSIRRCTFDAYQTPELWQAKAKAMAKRYVSEREGWFVVSGASGSGKTHLCTAICGELLRQNVNTRYLQWRSDTPELKALVNTDEYAKAMYGYRNAHCLYIDDFWKGALTDADIKLTFDILNSRYNDETKLTVISTELPIERILEVDEAIGSRIYERSRGRYISITGDNKNWRLRRITEDN